MKYDVEDISEYCAPNTSFTDEMIHISDQVSLRLITFIPAKPPNQTPILFVPGWISVIAGWKQVLLEMTAENTVYYVETREKKTSLVGPNEKMDVETIGKDIVAIVDHLQLVENRYILFGSSLGGTTILDGYRFLQQKPKCMVLIGPNAVIRVPLFGRIGVRCIYPALYEFVKPFVKWYLRHFRLDVETDPAQYAKYCRALDMADPVKLKKALNPLSKYKVWNILSDIERPVLIFNAAKDVMHEPQNLEKMASILPNATIIDLQTNHNTHSADMVREMYKYISKLG